MGRLRHVGLRVPDVRAAEEHYRTLFAAQLVGRETATAEDEWWAIPPHLSWPDLDRLGVRVEWVGLRAGDLAIALFRGDPAPDRTLYCIGVRMPPAEVAALRDRLPRSVRVEVDTPSAITFVDRFGFRWQCNDLPFVTVGDSEGRWLRLPDGSRDG